MFKKILLILLAFQIGIFASDGEDLYETDLAIGGRKPPRKWTEQEDIKLLELSTKNNALNWIRTAEEMAAAGFPLNEIQCRQRYSHIKGKHSRGRWTDEEDKKLIAAVNKKSNREKFGNLLWVKIAEDVGTRNSKQCRVRWESYLEPAAPTTAAEPAAPYVPAMNPRKRALRSADILPVVAAAPTTAAEPESKKANTQVDSAAVQPAALVSASSSLTASHPTSIAAPPSLLVSSEVPCYLFFSSQVFTPITPGSPHYCLDPSHCLICLCK